MSRTFAQTQSSDFFSDPNVEALSQMLYCNIHAAFGSLNEKVVKLGGQFAQALDKTMSEWSSAHEKREIERLGGADRIQKFRELYLAACHHLGRVMHSHESHDQVYMTRGIPPIRFLKCLYSNFAARPEVRDASYFSMSSERRMMIFRHVLQQTFVVDAVSFEVQAQARDVGPILGKAVESRQVHLARDETDEVHSVVSMSTSMFGWEDGDDSVSVAAERQMRSGQSRRQAPSMRGESTQRRDTERAEPARRKGVQEDESVHTSRLVDQEEETGTVMSKGTKLTKASGSTRFTGATGLSSARFAKAQRLDGLAESAQGSERTPTVPREKTGADDDRVSVASHRSFELVLDDAMLEDSHSQVGNTRRQAAGALEAKPAAGALEAKPAAETTEQNSDNELETLRRRLEQLESAKKSKEKAQ